MITIFAIPKPFKDRHIDIIQRNAIQSWLKLRPRCEIILFGDDDGVKEVADEYGLIHIGDIHKNESGTPTLDYVFKAAQEKASSDIVCYVNADIILTHSFISAVKQIAFPQFLLVCQRYNLDISESIDFSRDDWEQKLLENAMANSTPFYPGAIDLFAFNRGLINDMLPFAVGRAGWDNWLIYNIRRKKVPVVDVTGSAVIIHQNHHYNHISPEKRVDWKDDESVQNCRLVGRHKSRMYLWDISDANWVLVNNRLMRHRQKGLMRVYRDSTLLAPRPYHGLIEGAYLLYQKAKRIHV